MHDPQRVVAKLAQGLPRAMQGHWKRNHSLFSDGLFRRGLTARLFALLQRLTSVDESWLRGLAALDVDARKRLVRDTFVPVLTNAWVKWALESPLHLVSIGVNYAQCERMLRIEGASDVAAFLLMHLERVADTDLARNWFAWFAVVGHYNHDDPEAVPPFLRRDRHEQSTRSDTTVDYHNRNILDLLDDAGPRTWSHYTLCDAPDWMNDETQKRLFEAIVRTGRPGGVLQYRTVERDSLVERHGMTDKLRPMVEETEEATRLDRTRQFRGVRYYRIAS